jgi:hypothetical protein
MFLVITNLTTRPFIPAARKPISVAIFDLLRKRRVRMKVLKRDVDKKVRRKALPCLSSFRDVV